MKIDKLIFKDRHDAFEQLCNILPIKEMMQEKWIILATSSGGVPIAYELANRLNGDFDYLFTKKIFTSKNNECEIAIITETGEIVIHEELMKSFGLKLEDLYNDANVQFLTEIEKYKNNYRSSDDLIELDGANVLLVDEGLNTGLTMMACIKSVINKNAKSICVAVPVLPSVTVNDIESIADDLYYVQAPEHFVSIDFYYEELIDIDLEDIKKLKI
ncbi:MAG: phosphoribosyltransferase family protein [Campylobacterota bacterium]|nr:phosphoribosyltransferase family protein [Campylobacterota bacterium]